MAQNSAATDLYSQRKGFLFSPRFLLHFFTRYLPTISRKPPSPKNFFTFQFLTFRLANFHPECFQTNNNMAKREIAGGVVHKMPADLRKSLASDPEARIAWEDITPLARNEWICWIKSAKKQETRNRRIERTCAALKEGKRHPCCWPGCPPSLKKIQLFAYTAWLLLIKRPLTNPIALRFI